MAERTSARRPDQNVAIAALVVAVLALAVSGGALWRTRSSSSTPTNTPASSSSGAATIQVPDEAGKNVYEAAADVAGLQLKPKTIGTHSADVPAGTVISQDPASGTKVAAGTTVGLTFSLGP